MASVRPALPAACMMACLAALLAVAGAASAWTGSAGGINGKDAAGVVAPDTLVYGSGDWTTYPLGSWPTIDIKCGGCGGTPVSMPDTWSAASTYSPALSLPFSFQFMGTTYTQVRLNSYGFLVFGGGLPGEPTPQPSNPLNTANMSPDDIVAGVYSDYANAGCNAAAGTTDPLWTVTSATKGTTPHRAFVVQYTDFRLGNGGTCSQLSNAGNTFQIRLYETTNVIEVHYRQYCSVYSPGAGFCSGTSEDTEMGLQGGAATTEGINYASAGFGSGSVISGTNKVVQYRPAGVVPFIQADTYTFSCGGICDETFIVDGLPHTPLPAYDKLTKNDHSVASASYRALYDSGIASGADLRAAVGGVCTGTHPSVAVDGSFCFKPPATANPCEDAPYTFYYKDQDGWGVTAPTLVTINLEDCNEPPSVGDYSYSTYEDVPLHVDAPGIVHPSFSIDPEGTTVLVDVPCLVYSGMGTVTINADGSFDYTPYLDFTGTETFDFCVVDGDGVKSVLGTVTLTVIPNDDPVASFSMSDAEPDAGRSTSFTDHSTDHDTLTTWAWDFGDARSSTQRNPTHTYTWPGSYIVRLTVCDQYGACSSTTRVIDVQFPPEGSTQEGPGSPVPVAVAGHDRLASAGQVVVLRGTYNGAPDIYQYRWRQVEGPEVTLRNATSATADFTAPAGRGAPVRLVFELVVANQDASSKGDRVEVLVRDANVAPVAAAGPAIQASPGQTVTLDASASTDEDGDELAYTWSQVAGLRVPLTAGSGGKATFTVPDDALGSTLLFRLEATDGIATSADSVQVLVVSAGRGPADVATATTGSGSQTQAPDAKASPAAGLGVAVGLLGVALLRRRKA